MRFLSYRSFLFFILTLLFLFSGCGASSQAHLGKIGLSPLKNSHPLSKWEEPYVRGDYSFFLQFDYKQDWTPKTQYIYLRALFHLKEWSRLSKIFQSFNVPFTDNLLGPYFLALALETDFAQKDILSAKKHYKVYLKSEDSFSPYLGEEKLKDSVAAFLGDASLASTKGGFYYYRYKQNPIFEKDFFISIREMYPDALADTTSKQFHKVIPRSFWFRYLPLLKEKNTSLYLELLKEMKSEDTLAQYYFDHGMYAQVLNVAPLNSFMYNASYLMVATNPLPVSVLENVQRFMPQISFYWNTYEFAQQNYEALKSFQKRDYVPQTLRYLIILGLKEERQKDLYQILKEIENRYISVMKADDKELLLFWLGILSRKEGRQEESKNYLQQLAREFPNTYYGSEALKELSSADRESIFSFWQQDYQNQKSSIQNFLTLMTSKKIPSNDLLIGRAMFFFRLREDNRGREYLREWFKPSSEQEREVWYYSLSRIFYSINRMDYFNFYFMKFFKGLESKLPQAALFSDVLPLLYPKKFSEIIEDAAKYYNFDPSFMEGLILQESLYDPLAKSWVGASGLSQLMPTTFEPLVKPLLRKKLIENSDVWNIKTNIFAGSSYLSWLIERIYKDAPEDEKMVLSYASYNAGPGHIRKISKEIPRPLIHTAQFVESIDFAETRNYTKKLIRNQRIYALIRDIG